VAKAERSRRWRIGGACWRAISWGIVVALAGPAAADEDVASIRIAAPAAAAWETLNDFLAWPAIFPDVAEVSLEHGDGVPLRMHQIVRVFGIRIEHTSSVAIDPAAYQLELRLDPSAPHDVDALDATWTIAPDEAGGSVIELRSRFTIAQPIPEFIRRRALQRSVRESVAALAAEVTRRSDALRLAAGP
jgi:hypothetical protein